MALERRVLLRASSNSLLVAVSGGILRALRPLRYRGTFVPVLPTSLADYADAPTPYLMGYRTRGAVPRGGTSAVSASSGDRHDGGSNPGLNGSNNSFLDDALTAERLEGVVVVDLDANVVTDLGRGIRGEGGDEERISRAKSPTRGAGGGKSHGYAAARSRSRGKSRERRTTNADDRSENETSWPGDAGDELARRLKHLTSPDLCEMDAGGARYDVGGGARYGVGGAQYGVGGARYDVEGDEHAGDAGEREFRAALAAANGSTDHRIPSSAAAAFDSGFSPLRMGGMGHQANKRAWSRAHDACAQLCFAALWRDVVRGYRSYLLDVPMSHSARTTDGGETSQPCFDVDGFLADGGTSHSSHSGGDGNGSGNGSSGPRLDPNRPPRGVSRSFAAAFVSTGAFARHCEVQIANAVSAAERDRRRFAAVPGSIPRGDTLSGTFPDVGQNARTRRGQNAGGARLVDPMLAEDHDDRANGAGSDSLGGKKGTTGRLVTGKIVRRPRVFAPASFEGASSRSSYASGRGRKEGPGFDSGVGRTRVVSTRGVTFRSVQLSRGELVDDVDPDGVRSGDLPHAGKGTCRLDDDDVGGFTAVGHGAGSPSPHALTLRASAGDDCASVEVSSHRQIHPPNPPRAGLSAMEPVTGVNGGHDRTTVGGGEREGGVAVGERDPWRSAVPGSNPVGGETSRDSDSSGLSFLGFADGADGANGTHGGTRLPVQRASSVTHGLTTQPVPPAGLRGNPPSGNLSAGSSSVLRKPRHGRSASSTSFFASPAGLVGNLSNSESDGEGSIPVKTNSGKSLAAYLASAASPPRMFGSPTKQRSFKNFRERRRQSEDMTNHLAPNHPASSSPANDPNHARTDHR